MSCNGCVTSLTSLLLLTLAFGQGATDASFSEVPVNEPFQVVMPSRNHTSMLPVAEGLSLLSRHHGPISVIAVVGPYHSGKSFLLNSLLGETGVFSIGRRTSPETMGIWLCRTSLHASDGSEVWLMDSEGFFGPGVAESYDAKIFTIASLLGGHLVYNTVKVIDQQAVNLLEMLARRAQLFRTRTSMETTSIDTPEFLSVRSFPPLTWVVEDFVQELPEEHAWDADPATSWLKAYLSDANNASHAGGVHQGEEVHILAKLYSSLKVQTLFLPATEKSQLQDLSNIRWDAVHPEFKKELAALKTHLLENLQARAFENKPMTGDTLNRALRFILQGLQKGKFHELPSLWATWTQQVAEMSVQDADTWFSDLLSSIDTGPDPVAVSEFNAKVEEARERSVQFYTELLRDFEVRPDISELQKRMAVGFGHKLILYHERVQRWVGEKMAELKDQHNSFLMQTELPCDPSWLRKKGEERSRDAVRLFGGTLEAFGTRGKPPKHGRAAGMPVFAQDPTSQLNSDLNNMLGAREHENEREILHLFKMSVKAADEAVDGELRLTGDRLLGSAGLQELRTLVGHRCWQAFEERLDKQQWLKNTSHYKTQRALVQTETLEARMNRFATANDRRLGEHFRLAEGRCTDSYKTRRENLVMPVAENELFAEHRKLAISIREMLEEQGREIMDTEAFRGALRRLVGHLDEGLLQVKQKNVELWKVHSDEATRCALRENHFAEKKCSLFCFFNKVPMVHREASRKNLLGCLSRSGTGGRMSASMQNQVFEDWYNKDLAHDVAMVWSNFYICIGTPVIGLIVLLVCTGGCGCCRPYQRYSSNPWVHQAQGQTFGHAGRFGNAPVWTTR